MLIVIESLMSVCIPTSNVGTRKSLSRRLLLAQVFKRYLMKMKKQILEALSDDVGIDEITKRIAMPEYKYMKLYDVLHRILQCANIIFAPK